MNGAVSLARACFIQQECPCRKLYMTQEINSNNADWLIEDGDQGNDPAAPKPWRVLVVDDVADVHAVTRLALNNVTYKGRKLEIISAYSGEQGYAQLAKESDIALVLLDVVMETDDAGLRLAKRIREDLHNDAVRIVLRTGQPGQAPESQVVVDFDVNDYKAKGDLTVEKLFTTVITSLRSYERMQAIEASRDGLAKLLEVTHDIYRLEAVSAKTPETLQQVGALVKLGSGDMLCVMQKTGETTRGP